MKNRLTWLGLGLGLAVCLGATLHVLARGRAPSLDTVDSLVEALRDKDPQVRFLAAKRLTMLRPTDKRLVPALIEALNDEEENVAGCAGSVLAGMSPECPEAMQALLGA